KIGVRSFHDQDRVFAIRLDHDRGDPAGLSLDAADMARIDPNRLEIADRGVGEHVVANGCDHHHRSAQPGGGHRLIGALAAVSHCKARRLDGFTLDRHPIHIGDEVHHIAADDRDARPVPLGHFPSLFVVRSGLLLIPMPKGPPGELAPPASVPRARLRSPSCPWLDATSAMNYAEILIPQRVHRVRRGRMASVDVVNARKSYGGVEVIHGVSLSISDGEFVTLVGPSGCGKSTLLRMIAGLESITAGQVKIGARIVNNLAPRDRDIAMVFQNYALYPHKTVEQNMSFGLKLRNTPKDEIQARVKRAADILHVVAYLSRYPRQLSGGQRQRVAMGRAIVRDPQVFLFDEPLSNLDAQLRVQMRAEIKELHQRLKTTTIYVTHDQIEAMTMADRIVVMRDGVVEQMGAPLELYDRPATLFVAGFIGSPSMDLLKGSITVKGKPHFVTESGVELP